jgi:TolA-binding protein
MRKWVIAAVLASSAWAGMASAQSVDGRVDKLEREMRAVQRKVFPGGNGLTLEPQITAPAQGPIAAPGSPASGVIVDLTERVSALESQMGTLTGQSEQNGYKIRQLEEAFAAYKTATDAKLQALQGAPVAEPAIGGPETSVDRATPTPAPGTVRPPVTRPTASTSNADSARVAAVAAIEKPSTGDPAEDGYTYGFRLWSAKYYPEAQAALKGVADKYPKHRRASFSQNLLGRAYLDEGKPALASVALYDSYKKWPDGERAADSLSYLGQALTRLKKPADACKVYDELADVYAGKMSASLRAQVTKGRADAKCG